MYIYMGQLATPGNLTTNVTPNTETDAFFITPGARNVCLVSLFMGGKASAATAISGIVGRMAKYGTASTGGTSFTLRAVDPASAGATAAAASRPTAGSTRTNYRVMTCGVAGPGGFVAEFPDAMMTAQGSGSNSIDMLDASGTASLAYEFSITTEE